MTNLKSQCKLCFDFFRQELIKPSLFVFIFFIIIIVVSWLILLMNTDMMNGAMNYLVEMMRGVGNDGVVSAWDLFLNNTRACIIAIAIGFIPFFFLGMYSLTINASIIGVIGSFYQVNHLSMILLVVGLMPHGIFEFPAIFISLAISLKTSLLMSKRIVGKLEVLDLKQHFFNVLRVFIIIVIPLLIMAACIEAYITPICMSWFM